MTIRIGADIDRKQMGKELKDLIFSKGYTSIYDFHLRCAQDRISYSALKDTIAGRREASVSALMNIADALEMKPLEFFAKFSFKRIA